MSQSTGRLSLSSLIALALMPLFIISCSDNAEVVRYKTPKAKPNVEMDAAPSSGSQSEDIVWQKPESWIDGRVSSMRMASFAIPYDDGGAADVSLTQLGGVAGGVLANLNRWRGQIALEPISEAQIGETTENRESASGGTYVYLELENDSQGQAIYGAIYEGSGYSVFAKMTASLEIAQASKEEFKAFCDSVALSD